MDIDEKIKQKLIDIAQDNSSGSSELAKRAAVTLLEIVASIQEAPNTSVQSLRTPILIFAKALLQAQPKMATLFNLVNRALLVINSQVVFGEAKAALEKYIYNFLSIVVSGSDGISEIFQPIITENTIVLTYSYSATVNKALINIKQKGINFEVFCSESRPIMEGRKTAQILATAGIGVTFIVDAAILFALQRSNVVIFGADAITTEGIVNKIGTMLIALAARHFNKPCYVLADSTKFLPSSYRLMTEEIHKQAEIWPDSPLEIIVFNRYFETIPLDFFTGVVTEYGILTMPEVKLHLTNLGICSELCTQL
ncbi:MAG: hypothetical protein IPK14_11735 [Blastocatellia bacterium]|nr:hypothetical protein [Blastocatellia bacterium]